MTPDEKDQAITTLEAERDEAREQAADAKSTLSAWFDLAKKIEADALPTLADGFKGYLRTSMNGGMPTKMADAAKNAFDDYCRLYAGRDLVPVLRGMSEAALQASEARVAERDRVVADQSRRIDAWQAQASENDSRALASEARVRELEEVLGPFAKSFSQMGRLLNEGYPWIDLKPRNYGGYLEKPLALEDFRRAQAALTSGGEGLTVSQSQPCGDGAQPILPPISEPSGPVAYRVKDFADGWFFYDHQTQLAEATRAELDGFLVQPLYLGAQAPATDTIIPKPSAGGEG